MKKIILFLALATTLVCSLLIVDASAATEGTPIYTVEDFEKIALLEAPAGGELPKYYLANDIDFGGKTYDSFVVEKFSGTLDGNGHCIFNFNITSANNSDCGMIGRLMEFGNVVIKDLQIGKPDQNVTITPSDTVSNKSFGILSAVVENQSTFTTTIQDVTIYGEINFPHALRASIGGFIGYSEYATFVECKMYGSIVFGAEDVMNTQYMKSGGFVGLCRYGENAFKNCENHANIFSYSCSSESVAAGFVPYSAGGSVVLEDCKNYGNITCPDYDIVEIGYMQSESYCSGMVGISDKAALTITKCVNYGDLVATKRLGTMVACVKGATDAVEDVIISNCKNEGKLTANVTHFNGAWGEANCTFKVEGYANLNAEEIVVTTNEPVVTTPYEDEGGENDLLGRDDTTTQATTTEAPTNAPNENNAPNNTTGAPEDKGCGGFVSVAAVIAVVVSSVGCAIVIKKH